MRRFIGAVSFLFSFVLLCSLCTSCCMANVLNRPLTGQQLAAATDDMTVALVHQHPQRNSGIIYPFCTGTWVAQDVILAAAHCVHGLAEAIDEENAPPSTDPDDAIQQMIKQLLGQKEEKPELKTQMIGLNIPFILADEVVNVGQNPAGQHNSVAFAVYPHEDIALLRVVKPLSIPAHKIAKLADERPDRGEVVSANGHVKGLYFTYITGVVSAYRDDMSALTGDSDAADITGPFMQISAPISYGNSGGGVFDATGKLVGVVSFLAPAPNAAFCVPVDTIRSIMQAEKVIPMVLNLDPSAPDPKEFRPTQK